MLCKGLNSGKSSGVDGLSAEFFKSFWNVIGHDLYDVFWSPSTKVFYP